MLVQLNTRLGGEDKLYTINDIDRAKSLSRLLVNMLASGATTDEPQLQIQLQMQLPQQFTAALMEHYINHLNGYKKRILNTKFLVKAFELADFMQDDT